MVNGPEVGSVSNFDNPLNSDELERVAAALQDNDPAGHASHSAWHFHGTIWFEGGQFHERIRRYGVDVDLLSADTLPELVEAANDKYGWD